MSEADKGKGSHEAAVARYRNLIYEDLVRSGKINTFKSHLSDILRFSGWSGRVRDRCTQYIKDEGIEHVNISHMLCDVIPFGREQVPGDIRESMLDILRSLAVANFSPEDFKLLKTENKQELTSETYLPLQYQARDKVPDYGDLSVFTQHPEVSISSPTEMHSPAPMSPNLFSTDHQTTSVRANSPNNLSREMGGIVLLDRVDPSKENVKLEKTEQRSRELKDREKLERERIRQELEKDRAVHRGDRKERSDRERPGVPPTSKSSQSKQPPILSATLINTMTSLDENDDEEELMEI